RSGVPGGLEAPDGHTRPKAREDLLRQPYRPLRSAWPRAAPAPGRRTSLPIQGSMRKLNAFRVPPRRDHCPRRPRRRRDRHRTTRMQASTTRKTLLALTLAAAFGGFAATAIRDGLDRPAHAETAAPAVLPGIAALPSAVAGQPLPSLAPMLEKVTPAVVSVRTRQVVRVSPFGDDP